MAINLFNYVVDNLFVKIVNLQDSMVQECVRQSPKQNYFKQVVKIDLGLLVQKVIVLIVPCKHIM